MPRRACLCCRQVVAMGAPIQPCERCAAAGCEEGFARMWKRAEDCPVRRKARKASHARAVVRAARRRRQRRRGGKNRW